MGTLMITSNQTLNLATYGLKSGDPITVICVGGGAGGGYGVAYDEGSTYTIAGTGGAAGAPGAGKNGGGGGAGGGYGAGGGGGAGYLTTSGGSGGGAGSYNITTYVLNNTTVNSIAVTIGAGGIGGSAELVDKGSYYSVGYTAPTNGGVTSFGSILSASGGIIGRGGRGQACGGGGGAGGYLFPQKIYGGVGGMGGRSLTNHTFNNGSGTIGPLLATSLRREMLKGSGGGGGAGNSALAYSELAQESQYGGAGGIAGSSGSYGVESHGSGLVVVLW